MSGGGKKVKVGYKYYLGWHMVLTQDRLDSINAIIYSDREAWTGNVTTNTEVTINKPNLMGGEEREGGWKGNVKFMFGDDTQLVDDYMAYHANRPVIPGHLSMYDDSGGWFAWLAARVLAGKLANQDIVDNSGYPIPAYRGVTSVLFKSFMFAAMNPYLKAISFLCTRIPKTLGLTNSVITLDGVKHANGAHILYEFYTNTDWGQGYGVGDMNTPSFVAGAATLFAEGLGLSFLWASETSAEEFQTSVESHIGGKVYVDPATGKFTLGLNRGGYIAALLPVFNESNVIALRSFQRATPAELVSEVTVIYGDDEQDKTTRVTVQNLAVIRSAGKVVRQVNTYKGLPNANLASRLALRDLAAVSTPLAKLEITTQAAGGTLYPGALFKFSWAKRGLVDVIFRVLDVEYSELKNGEIYVSAIEDIFGMPMSTYMATQPGFWTQLPNNLANISSYVLTEAPYYAIIKAQGEDYAPNLADNRNFVGSIAARSNGWWTAYRLWELVAGSYIERIAGGFSPWVTLSAEITQLQTSIVYLSFYDLGMVEIGDIGVIDSEWVQITALNEGTQAITLVRGILDTVPVKHANGARLWIVGEAFVVDDTTERHAGETVTYKMAPETADERMDIAAATARNYTLLGRQQKPYPPANVKINTEYFPADVIDDIVSTWVGRDRTIQTVDPVAWTAANIGPEVGVTYTARYYRVSDNALLFTAAGLTTPTHTASETEIGEESEVRIEIETVRAAITSWQKFIHTVTRAVTSSIYSMRLAVDTPLAYWKLGQANGTAVRDVSGNARNGTAAISQTAVAGLLIPGSVNKATSFPAGTQWIEVPYVAALAPTAAVGVELWVKFNSFPSGPTTEQSLISKTEAGGYALTISNVTGMLTFFLRRNGVYAEVNYALSNLVVGVTYHFMATYDGRYAVFYVDGVAVATNDAGATYPIQYANNNSLLIGAEATSTTGHDARPPLDGVIDEVSVYGAALSATQVLAHFKLGGNQVTFREDAFYDKLALLMHFEGANASTTFTDVTGRTVTPFGNAQISTAQFKFGAASGLFDGTGDYLTVPHHVDLTMSSNPYFTVEMWFRTTTVAAIKMLACKMTDSSHNEWAVFTNAAAKVCFQVGGTSGAIIVDLIGTTVLSTATWYHVAVSMRKGRWTLFLNGKVEASGASSLGIQASAQPVYIGRNPLSGMTAQDWSGNIDELRITKASRYGPAFAQPAEAFPEQNVVAKTVDPFFAETKLLLHMDGTNGSTTFTDQIGKTMTAVGNAQISTAQSKFGGASALFDGTGDWVQTPGHADFVFGTGDFTVECWIKTSTAAIKVFIDFFTTSQLSWQLAVSATGQLLWFSSSLYTGGTGLVDGNWHHVAVSRTSGTLRMFIDGAVVNTIIFANNLSYSSPLLTIGAQVNTRAASADWNGHIDDVRITKGVGRYTENFAPVKQAWPDA